MDLKNLKPKPIVEDFCQMFVIIKNKSRTMGKRSAGWPYIGIKNLGKSTLYRLAQECCFSVTSTSSLNCDRSTVRRMAA
jgi:hypothetical protein